MLFDLSHFSYQYAQFAARAGDGFGGLDGFHTFVTAVLLIGCVALALRPGRTWRSTPAYCAALLISLFAVRIPTFFPILYNPDEASMLAGARRLLYDPIFWRSVDGTTGGPLDFYPLLLVRLLGLPLDYAGGRVLAVLALWSAVVFLFLTARLLMPERFARLSVLPLQAALMLFGFSELLQYTSECVPIALTGLSVWLLARRYLAAEEKRWEWALLGVALVALPLAKLQSAPTAAVLGAAALAAAWIRRRNASTPAAWLLGGVAGSVAILLAGLAAFGLFHDFNESYLRNNLLYADRAEVAWTFKSFFSDFAFGLPDIGHFLTWGAVFVVLAIAYRIWRGARRPSAAGVLALGLMAAATYQIYRPGRPFWHYLMFLLIPTGVALIAAFAALLLAGGKNVEAPGSGKQEKRRPGMMAAAFIVLTMAVPFLQGVSGSGRISHAWLTGLPERETIPAAQRMQELLKPGDLLAVWGWAPELYVRTGTVPATRDPHTQRQIEAGPQREYYRSRFVDDLLANPPKIVAEAVGPMRRAYTQREVQGLQSVPRLWAYVQANYELTDDIESVRIYVRRGVPAAGAAAPVQTPFAMRSGGGAVVDQTGTRWNGESYVYAGSPEQFGRIAELPDLSPIFLADRACPVTCEYAFPIANGDYRIRLHFIELVYSAPNARIFDVLVNQAPAFRDFDIVSEVGGAGRPLVKETQAQVRNGRLTIVLLPKIREAKINAIEILPVN